MRLVNNLAMVGHPLGIAVEERAVHVHVHIHARGKRLRLERLRGKGVNSRELWDKLALMRSSPTFSFAQARRLLDTRNLSPGSLSSASSLSPFSSQHLLSLLPWGVHSRFARSLLPKQHNQCEQ
eukprot:1907788-Amphidinium_carterae.1